MFRGIDKVGTTRFIVVDDFIASGETIEAIIQALDRQLEVFPHPTKKAEETHEKQLLGTFYISRRENL